MQPARARVGGGKQLAYAKAISRLPRKVAFTATNAASALTLGTASAVSAAPNYAANRTVKTKTL
jgi:hypothetical protein